MFPVPSFGVPRLPVDPSPVPLSPLLFPSLLSRGADVPEDSAVGVARPTVLERGTYVRTHADADMVDLTLGFD